MNSLKEQKQNKCKHFSGLSEDTCKAGVKYADVKIPLGQGKVFDIPCLKDYCTNSTCGKREFYTDAEIDEQVAESARRFERICLIRAAIVERLGGPWKRGMEGSGGSIACPACKTGAVSFSRSGCNGHIHARCSTPDCASWME